MHITCRDSAIVLTPENSQEREWTVDNNDRNEPSITLGTVSDERIDGEERVLREFDYE